MKRSAFIVAALVIGLGWVVLSRPEVDSVDPTGATFTEDRIPRRSAPTPADAEKKLRDFLNQKPDASTSFATIQRLASHLSDAALQELVGEVGLGKSQGYDDWLRSALFAEWAKRDLDAALDYLRHADGPEGTYDSCIQQAAFAIFRGSRPSDPEAALAHLDFLRNDRELGRDGSGNDWVQHLKERLFTELSQKDPDLAWTLLPDLSDDPRLKYSALLGFFKGLTNNQQFSHFADLWHQTYFNRNDEFPSNEAITNLGKLRIQPIPSQNEDVAMIAGTWMKHSPQAAINWLHDKASTTSEDDERRMSLALNIWAYDHPGQALAALREQRYQENSTEIAVRIIRANAHLAPEIASIRNASINQHTAFAGSMTLNAMLEGAAQYPDPHLNNRAPDYVERAASLRTAIESEGLFNEKRRTELLESLERQFEDRLAE